MTGWCVPRLVVYGSIVAVLIALAATGLALQREACWISKWVDKNPEGLRVLRLMVAVTPRASLKCKGRSLLADLELSGTPQVYEVLLKAGADANMVEQTGGMSPLQVVASWGSLPRVELLVKHGARVDHQDADGKTAVMYAALSRPEDDALAIIRYLHDSGADLKVLDNSGLSARDYALQVGSARLAVALDEMARARD